MAIEKNKGTIKFVDNNGNNYIISSYKNTFAEELIKNKGTISLILSNGTILKNSSYKNKINKNLIKRYKVIFKNWDGTILQISYVDEGGTAEYTGATPTKVIDGDEHTFNGWDKEFSNVTSNMIVTATFTNIKPSVFTLNFTDETALTPKIYLGLIDNAEIDWGDGNTESVNASSGRYVTHTYNSIGNYVVKILVTYFKGNEYIVVDDCESYVTSVYLQEGFKKVGDNAFRECTNLQSVTIPDSVTLIRQFAFYNCKSLTSIKIPNSVTSICLESFESCESLTSIEIPNSVTSIEGYAFSRCTRLESVVMVSTTPPTLSLNVFNKCTNLQEIRVPMDSVEAYKSATNWSAYADKIVGY